MPRTYSPSIKTSLFGLTLALSACGRPQSSDSVPTLSPENANPVPEVVEKIVPAAPAPKVPERVEIVVSSHLIEPAKVGSAWKRFFKITDRDPKFVVVEKRGSIDAAWAPAGFTDTNGEFVDTSIELKTQYRFGTKVETELFEGVADLVLKGTLCTDDIQHAYRVAIAPGSEVLLQNCSLRVMATVVQFDGVLKSFEPGTKGGANAGRLTVVADEMRGKGAIVLAGQDGQGGWDGRTGRKGADGTREHPDAEAGSPGTNGTGGQRGGNGGEIFFAVKHLSFENWSLVGGVGGPGGSGGPGGQGGKGAVFERRQCGRECDGMTETVYGKDGASGARGSNGAPGSSGESGRILSGVPSI